MHRARAQEAQRQAIIEHDQRTVAVAIGDQRAEDAQAGDVQRGHDCFPSFLSRLIQKKA